MSIITELAPDLHLIQPGKSYHGYMKANVFLIGRNVLIDSGPSGIRSPRRLLKALKELGVNHLDYLLLTHGHPDHSGGAKKLKEEMGARIAMSREESAKLKESVPIDLWLEPEKKLEGVDISCIHTPGHCSGHYCFYLPARSLLFSGDLIPGWGTTVISPPGGDMQDYLESLHKLSRLSLSLLCPGHGPPVRNPQEKIKELIEHRLERERQVFSCLEEGKKNIRAILEKIYPELGKKLWPLARRQIAAHLIKLEKEGKVRRTSRGWKITKLPTRPHLVSEGHDKQQGSIYRTRHDD